MEHKEKELDGAYATGRSLCMINFDSCKIAERGRFSPTWERNCSRGSLLPSKDGGSKVLTSSPRNHPLLMLHVRAQTKHHRRNSALSSSFFKPGVNGMQPNSPTLQFPSTFSFYLLLLRPPWLLVLRRISADRVSGCAWR